MIQEVNVYICYEDVPQSPEKVLHPLRHLQLNQIKHWALIFLADDWCQRVELDIDENMIIKPKSQDIDFRKYVTQYVI